MAARADQGVAVLTPAQLSMLLEGIDWRRPVRTAQPVLAG
jgi:transposase